MTSVSTDKKELILEAGQKAIDRYGYKKATLSDIARLCGIGKSSIYYYFENKEDLFNEIFTREAFKFTGLLQKLTAEAPDPVEAILAYVDCRKIFATQNRKLSNVAIGTFMEVKPIALKNLEDIRDQCIQIIEQQIVEGMKQDLYRSDINAREIADSIETITRSVELDEVHNAGVKNFSEVDHEAIADKSKRIIQLILNGIRT